MSALARGLEERPACSSRETPSDLRLRPHPFGPLLVAFTSGIARSFSAHDRLGHWRVRSGRWLPRTRHPSSPRRRLGDGGSPADAEEHAYVRGVTLARTDSTPVATDLSGTRMDPLDRA